jgi:hypothetical protein
MTIFLMRYAFLTLIGRPWQTKKTPKTDTMTEPKAVIGLQQPPYQPANHQKQWKSKVPWQNPRALRENFTPHAWDSRMERSEDDL